MFNLTPWRKQTADSGSLLPTSEHPLSRIRDEFDALFDRFFGGWPDVFNAGNGGQRFWGLDMDDTEKELVVRAEAPGFEAKDFDIHVSGNVLTIRAERKEEAQEQMHDYSFSQRRLQRSVTLPATVNPDQIEAHYRNGVLELRLPKTEEARGRRIEVKSS